VPHQRQSLLPPQQAIALQVLVEVRGEFGDTVGGSVGTVS
jgi:hypothetical protein